MLGEVGARSQNSKYFSLNHLMLWDLKSEQTLFPLEAETRKNLKSIRLKITFPKIFHISVAMLDSKKITEVYECLDVNTWCVMLLCDLPLKASRKGDCNASIAKYNSMSFGGCRRITWKQPLLNSFAAAAHLHSRWINESWMKRLPVLPGPSFPLFLCAFQIAQENRWCTPHSFVPNELKSQNFFVIMIKLDLDVCCPMSLTRHINIILQILSLV